MYSIYEIWFHFFCLTIPLYDDKTASALIDYAIYVLKEITKKKIIPTISLYSKLIKACGRQSLSDRVMMIFNTMPRNYKQNNTLYYNSFMNGLYNQDSIFETSATNKTMSKQKTKQSTKEFKLKEHPVNPYLENMSNLIFLGYDYCYNCYATKKIKRKVSIEEIFGGFKKDHSNHYSTCNICLINYQPL